LYLICR